ncbi:MAG: hypothetical protein H0T73_02720, partial [Ardenticatenales bacterium]|nr:hypothetical protein [Ardenticatenales bacterium]
MKNNSTVKETFTKAGMVASFAPERLQARTSAMEEAVAESGVEWSRITGHADIRDVKFADLLGLVREIEEMQQALRNAKTPEEGEKIAGELKKRLDESLTQLASQRESAEQTKVLIDKICLTTVEVILGISLAVGAWAAAPAWLLPLLYAASSIIQMGVKKGVKGERYGTSEIMVDAIINAISTGASYGVMAGHGLLAEEMVGKVEGLGENVVNRLMRGLMNTATNRLIQEAVGMTTSKEARNERIRDKVIKTVEATLLQIIKDVSYELPRYAATDGMNATARETQLVSYLTNIAGNPVVGNFVISTLMEKVNAKLLGQKPYVGSKGTFSKEEAEEEEVYEPSLLEVKLEEMEFTLSFMDQQLSIAQSLKQSVKPQITSMERGVAELERGHPEYIRLLQEQEAIGGALGQRGNPEEEADLERELQQLVAEESGMEVEPIQASQKNPLIDEALRELEDLVGDVSLPQMADEAQLDFLKGAKDEVEALRDIYEGAKDNLENLPQDRIRLRQGIAQLRMMIEEVKSERLVQTLSKPSREKGSEPKAKAKVEASPLPMQSPQPTPSKAVSATPVLVKPLETQSTKKEGASTSSQTETTGNLKGVLQGIQSLIAEVGPSQPLVNLDAGPPSIEDMSQAYRADMAYTNAWGSEVEAQAMGQILNHQINIYVVGPGPRLELRERMGQGTPVSILFH